MIIYHLGFSVLLWWQWMGGQRQPQSSESWSQDAFNCAQDEDQRKRTHIQTQRGRERRKQEKKVDWAGKNNEVFLNPCRPGPSLNPNHMCLYLFLLFVFFCVKKGKNESNLNFNAAVIFAWFFVLALLHYHQLVSSFKQCPATESSRKGRGQKMWA